MDVVKKNIEKLNGTIEVESKFGVETRIRLKIPLTLAIIQALLVRVGLDSFTIPLANVEETLRVAEAEISIMEETEVMYLRGKTLPIFRLAILFGLKSNQQANETDFFVVVVNTGNQRIGLMVDALLGQEEVVIKPLADYLHEQNCFSGATIIGDGRISLILDVYELINMTTDRQIKKHHEQEKKSLASLAE
jgi:two-component system chemotaxis sensor kinase CheA